MDELRAYTWQHETGDWFCSDDITLTVKKFEDSKCTCAQCQAGLPKKGDAKQ